MEYISKFGIDFGTTNSSIALCSMDPEVGLTTQCFEVDVNSLLPRTLSSIVAFDDRGQSYVGTRAKHFFAAKKAKTIVREVKWKLIEENFSLKVGSHTFRAKDVASVILKELRSKAMPKVKENVDGVVMGVPVGLPDTAKRDLLRALVTAEFYGSLQEAHEKTEFVSEPIAVALHYGMQKANAQRVMVFDFGGGTLDLTVMDIGRINEKKELLPDDVLAKEGLKLGGERFTKLFFEHVFLPKYGENKLAQHLGFGRYKDAESLWQYMEQDEVGIALIQKLDEKKIQLSNEDMVEMSFFEGNVWVDMEFTREEFETAIYSELPKIKDTIFRCLKENYQHKPLHPTDIDVVLMAGGSSLIPIVQEIVWDIFGKQRVRVDDREETLTCIARGLAAAGWKDESAKPKFFDVVDSDYGIWDGLNEKIEVIIPKNTKVKDTQVDYLTQEGISKKFKTVSDNPSHIRLQVFQDQDRLGVVEAPVSYLNKPGKFKIFFSVDEQKGWLTVHIYDRLRSDWMHEIPEEKRSFETLKK